MQGFRIPATDEPTAGYDMKRTSVPQRREAPATDSSRNRSRWGVIRDLGVFELKLAVDGLKDFVLAPLALGAALADLVIPSGNRGVLLNSVLRIGERFDQWLGLYRLRRRDETRTVLDEGGSDVILDYIESTALDLHRSISRRGRTPPED